ncbi:lipase family protein [Kineobactrum salinum]|uniref:Lipase family protein n=1 Tax=Kineobactrum salinum TaxID=2708301 RepID=A0A6C0U020_9GAMM|nr:lipase family protein [Kineobactrum salinum]QIB65356.1 lipase family protein [Kineobactrum salinum]
MNNHRLLILAILALLAACSGLPDAHSLAARHQLDLQLLDTPGFTLPALSGADPGAGQPLHLYIPGDGRPWRGRQVSPNPTGHTALALELMLRDPAPGILLGRPCYYLATLPANCEPALWTSGRYSAQVVDAMLAAMRQLLVQRQPSSLVLIGYSGGGVLALLLADRLTATSAPNALPVAVITVASNLDIQHWTGYHGHLPLSDSLNPATVLPPVPPFRQFHLAGGLDPVVPASTTASFRQRQPGAHYQRFDDFDHRCCWVRDWPAILDGLLTFVGN